MALNLGIQIAIVTAALVAPVVARAECRSVTLPAGSSVASGVRDSNGREVKPTLVFSGTVTAMNVEKYTVTLTVDRVWQGPLHRETTLFVAPVIEGAGVSSFQIGSAYLVTSYAQLTVFGPEDHAATGLPSNTIGVIFGCIDGPVPLAKASAELKRLGPGRAPQP